VSPGDAIGTTDPRLDGAEGEPFPGLLEGERVRLRLAVEDDIGAFAAILVEPAIAEWWPRQDADRLRAEMLEDADVTAYAIELDGAIIGAIMCSEETDPDYRSAGIDLFLDSAHLGQGLGSDAIRTLARWLFDSRDHHRLTIDPAVTNGRARAAYEKVGFKPVGVMRGYERGADCRWHDGLLMDMLRGELR
jgi:aminoglycoside 6'-N-acetyltransferase